MGLVDQVVQVGLGVQVGQVGQVVLGVQLVLEVQVDPVVVPVRRILDQLVGLQDRLVQQ